MDNASFKLIESATNRTLHAQGFSRASSQASLVLSDLLSRYLTLLSATCVKHAQHAGRRGLTARDAFGALEEMGVSVDELYQYCSTEGKELNRYAIYSARRVEDLYEFRAHLADGLRQDRDDAIPLHYAPYELYSEEEASESENEEESNPEEQSLNGNAMDVDVPITKPAVPPTDRDTGVTRMSSPPLPLSPISNPSSPARKRPRKASWDAPSHIPSFLPPFPSSNAPSPPPVVESPKPILGQFEPLPPSVSTETIRLEKPLLNLAANPSVTTTAAASDYLTQVPYSQSSLSSVAEWHLPSSQPPPPPSPPVQKHVLATPQTEHSLFAAYHHILTHPPPPNSQSSTPARHRVAMALLSLIQNTPRWEPPDTLYSSVAPCPPRQTVIGPTFPMTVADSGSDKDVKLPPSQPRPVTTSERISPLVSQQLSRIPDLARLVLPPTIHSRTSRLTHPPPLQRGNKLLVYGSGVPAPWNANAPPTQDQVPPTPSIGKAKDKDREKEPSDAASKPVLPDARLYATWDSETKDYRVPLAPIGKTRGRMGSVQGGSGVISLQLGSRGKATK